MKKVIYVFIFLLVFLSGCNQESKDDWCMESDGQDTDVCISHKYLEDTYSGQEGYLENLPRIFLRVNSEMPDFTKLFYVKDKETGDIIQASSSMINTNGFDMSVIDNQLVYFNYVNEDFVTTSIYARFYIEMDVSIFIDQELLDQHEQHYHAYNGNEILVDKIELKSGESIDDFDWSTLFLCLDSSYEDILEEYYVDLSEDQIEVSKIESNDVMNYIITIEYTNQFSETGYFIFYLDVIED